MNLLDKAINDAKRRKAKKSQIDNPPKLEGTSLGDVGSKLSRDAQYIENYAVETPIHLDTNAYDVINTYRGSYKQAVMQQDGEAFEGTTKDSKGNTLKDRIYKYNTVAAPSLFNPFYAITSTGISPGVPLLDNIANQTNFKATKLDGKELNWSINLEALDDCSIANLVKLSNEEDSILGQARYKYSDFMYCRDVGKISNNHLITLRRFSAPVRDNIYQYTGIDKDTSNQVPGDIGRLVTWFGTEDNKLEDILKYSFHASWKEMEAAIDQQDSQENDSARGLTGGLVNLMNNKHAEGVDKGIHASAFKQLLGDDASDYDDGPYANNDAVNGRMFDKHKIYEPKDSIRSKYQYEGNLKFSQDFTLTFNYKLRGYDNINGKTAMLDLLGNILAVTYRKGKFWPGEQHIIGAPQNTQGWNKAVEMQNDVISAGNTFISKLCNGGTLADAASSAINVIQGADLGKKALEGAKEILENLKAGGLQSIFSGLVKNSLGRPAVYAFDSLLTEGETGFWHVTIGNPLNPIASIGNLIIDGDVEITHGGPLGLDDFPTEITVKVPLKHAMPRDSVDIQRMFTKGRRSIYTELPANKDQFNTKSLDIQGKGGTHDNKVISTALSKTFDSINLGYANTSQKHTAYSYFGDHDIVRITKNADALRQA